MYDYCIDYYPDIKTSMNDFCDKISSFFESGEMLLIPLKDGGLDHCEMVFSETGEQL